MEENIAQEMLRVLSTHRTWTSGRLQAGPRRCLLGARLRADGVMRMSSSETNLAYLNHDLYTLLLARIICEQFPERIHPLAGETLETPVKKIMSFNDWESTRFTDIRMVLEKAAVRWDEHKENNDE